MTFLKMLESIRTPFWDQVAAAVTLLAVPLPLLVSLATQGWTQLLATTAVSTLSLALCLPAAGLLPCERRLLFRTLKKHFGCHA